MKCHFSIAMLGLLVTACSSAPDTRLLSVADLPLKSTTLPSFSIEQAPLRANARYITYDAKTGKERKLKVGDYYYVRWYDAHPEEPVRVVMHYTQAASGATPQMRELRLDEPREARKIMVTPFFFTGEDRARKGDVMTWKVELYCGGQLKDVHRSYMWRDTPKTPVALESAEKEAVQDEVTAAADAVTPLPITVELPAARSHSPAAAVPAAPAGASSPAGSSGASGASGSSASSAPVAPLPAPVE